VNTSPTGIHISPACLPRHTPSPNVCSWQESLNVLSRFVVWACCLADLSKRTV
jgi:hypothetical protein